MAKRKREKKPKPFATEAELCAAFIGCLPDEWVSYNECCDWDLLLVRKADGFQIGVQAKLRMNVEVINQAIEQAESSYGRGRAGPDCRAVLVPHGDGGKFDQICEFVGLTVIRVTVQPKLGGDGYRCGFQPELPTKKDVAYGSWNNGRWHEMAPTRRHELPKYVPDVRAGSSAPLQLTEWKIKALKIAVLLEERGHVTRGDFRHLDLDHRRWVAQEWLRASPDGYVPDKHMPNFRKQHPRVYEEIKAEADWRPARSLLGDVQGAPTQENML